MCYILCFLIFLLFNLLNRFFLYGLLYSFIQSVILHESYIKIFTALSWRSIKCEIKSVWELWNAFLKLNKNAVITIKIRQSQCLLISSLSYTAEMDFLFYQRILNYFKGLHQRKINLHCKKFPFNNKQCDNNNNNNNTWFT